MNADERAEALSLARDIMFGIEKDRVDIDRSILKATRLARQVRDTEAEDWLEREVQGFAAADRDLQLFRDDRRAYEDHRHDVYASGLAITGQIEALKLEIGTYSLTTVSGDWANKVASDNRTVVAARRSHIQRLLTVSAAIEARVHKFATTAYHALSFESAMEGIFDSARGTIDELLLDKDPELSKKLDYAMRSLSDDEPEAVSAATNSLRRLVTSFADAIYPSSPEPRQLPGAGTVQVGQAQYLNRIKAYIDDHHASNSRKHKLKQQITNLNSRLSAGVHDEVTTTEARFLLIEAYVVCGEILSA